MRAFELSAGLRRSMADYLQGLAFPVREALRDSGDVTGLPDKINAFLEGEDDRISHSGAGFVSPLYIERQMPYEVSETSLCRIAGLDEDVAKAFAKYLLDDPEAEPRNVRLYRHQENSFRTVSGGRNLVVCTGTGSGKTECFLLPLVDAIVKERKAAQRGGGNYHPGVRAMILYPMNALVNDQVRRLKRFIQYLPEAVRPTFGLFTGDLKSNERPLDELKIRDLEATFPENTFSFAARGNAPGTINSDIPIHSQYVHRWEWTARGPADILVTNYSMLERLLLLPERTAIFDTGTWRFIVLDEAHSYTGSNGTEIAWLIRRLAHRVKPDDIDSIQYIATSATLKTGTSEEVSAFIKNEFASKIFPASADTFDVELEKYQSVTRGFGHAYNGDLTALCREEIYRETVTFLQEWKHNGTALQCAAAIEQLFRQRGNDWSAQEAYYVMSTMPDLKPDKAVFNVTQNIVDLIRFALRFYGESEDDWADWLHDALDPRKRDTQEQWASNGNRLDILREWKRIKRDGNGQITYEQFDYLYSRCLEAMNDLSESSLRYSLGDLKVSLSTGFANDLRDYAGAIRASRTELEARQRNLTRQWADRLGIDGEERLESILYKALCDREDVIRLQNEICTTTKCLKFDDVARQLYGDDDHSREKLACLLELGMIAVNSGERLPLLDIRYHQMVRGLADNEVAVEFPDGTPQSLTLRRTLETTWGEDGNFLFNLGACRDCGMPYLLAYSNVEDLARADRPVLVRDYSEHYCFLHAFALCPGGEEHQLELDAVPEGEDDPPVYIDLKTGQCSGENFGGARKVYWYRHGTAGNNNSRSRFIDKCPNCKGTSQAGSKAEYGVITPFSGTDEMMRLYLLREFAEQAEPDLDPVIQGKPGSGKKVLAFADSRRGASSGAYKFHDLFSRMYLNELVVESVIEAENDPRVSREEILRRWQQQVPPGTPDEVIAALVDREFALAQQNPPPPTLSRVAAILMKKAKEKKCTNLLQFVKRGDPWRFIAGEDSALICVLRVLRDFARRGVLKSNRVTLDLQLPEDFGNDMRLPFPAETLRDLVKKIFGHLWWNMEMEIPQEWAATYIDSRPNRMHCYARERHDGRQRPEGLGHFPEVKSFSNSRKCRALLRECCPDRQINATESGQILEQIRARLENTLFVRNEDADGWGLDWAYLKDHLMLRPGGPDVRADTVVSPLRIEEHTAQLSTAMGRVYQKAFSNGDINILLR